MNEHEQNTETKNAHDDSASELSGLVSQELLLKRLANTENALFALWSLMQETLPPAYQHDIGGMMRQYFDANRKLGAEFYIKNGFISG